MSELSLGKRLSNLKSVALTVFELLEFNNQKFRGSRDLGGHVTLTTPPFRKILRSHVRTVPANSLPNFKSVALTVSSY